jgi:anti-sigma factor RsiW
MNDCPNGELRDLLPDLLHDRLAPAERRMLEEHLRACADCRAELALLGDLRAGMQRAPAISSASVDAIAAALPAYRAPARRGWSGRASWRVAAAIVVLAAGGSAVGIVQRGGMRAGAGDSVIAAGDATVPEAPRELAMAGGSLSDLDEGELTMLLAEIETLDALPAVDVEPATPLTPIAPSPSGGLN